MTHSPTGSKPDRSSSEHDGSESVPQEIAIVGDLTENASDLVDKVLGVEPGSKCTIYFDSPGGNLYTANSLVAMIRLRGLQATGIVTGECSSAAVWPFAACTRRACDCIERIALSSHEMAK